MASSLPGEEGEIASYGGINIRWAHWLPGKPAEPHTPHGPFDKNNHQLGLGASVGKSVMCVSVGDAGTGPAGM